ncbi:MAG: ABC transporter permease [Candidatus Faecisoma sp.]|nr:ABC transporter permease [Candidatus Faecisoma sp.]CCY28659.1 aBC-2 type transporter [Acholeplasma sp. CAG:878]
MFIHNLKYTIKILFKNKVLIFWTFAFPIILGLLFNMAFSNIEKDEMLKVFSIAVVSNDNSKEQEIYKETLEKLSTGDARLFNLKYVDEEEANRLLDESEIEGYVVISDDVKVVIKENGSNQTIIKFVIQEIKQNKKIVEDLSLKEIEKETSNGNYSFDTTEIVNNILTKINSQEVSLNSLSSSNLSYMTIEYYTLIAMACMYTGMLGLTSINNCLANMSNKGKRISVSPNKKSTIVLSSLIGSYIVSLLGLSILLLFLLFVLKVDFGNNMLLVILLSMIGSLAGISLGVLVASVFKLSEGAKTGIIIAISMFLSVLSGMTGVTLKYVIDTNVPIVNLINPNNLITDGFYSLYYYNTLDRYFRDLIYLIIFVIICLVISFFSLRREQYDSI